MLDFEFCKGGKSYRISYDPSNTIKFGLFNEAGEGLELSEKDWNKIEEKFYEILDEYFDKNF
jgi:hypothetical protein